MLGIVISRAENSPHCLTEELLPIKEQLLRLLGKNCGALAYLAGGVVGSAGPGLAGPVVGVAGPGPGFLHGALDFFAIRICLLMKGLIDFSVIIYHPSQAVKRLSN